MKNKTKFLLTTLFILVAFLLLGTTNVNATTVIVETEQQLRDALDGVKEVDGSTVTDTDTTEVKLDADIKLTDGLQITAITDLTLDLNGHVITGEDNQKGIEVLFGFNGIAKFDIGSLTIKDSSPSKIGTIKVCGTFTIRSENIKSDSNKNYKFIVEDGKFYMTYSKKMFKIVANKSFLKDKNVTFDIQVKNAYFDVDAPEVTLLETSKLNEYNVALKVNYDKLTLKSRQTVGIPKLIYSDDKNFTLGDIVSSDSNIKIKHTGNGTTATVTDRTLSAISSDPFEEILPKYDTIEITKAEVFDVTTSVVGGNGTISTSYANVVEGSTKEITFTPNTGYMIDKVTVNGTPVTVTNNKLTLIVNENKDVKVSYKKIPFTITVVDTEGAIIDPNGSIAVNYGDSKQFTIYADYGYNFVKVLVNGVDKTAEMVGDTLTLNNITASMEIKVVVEKIEYEVIEGANQKYTITKDTEAKFRIDAEYGLFLQRGAVYVDDELVDEDNYTTEEGSTIVTLKQSYVDTLSVGEHTLKVTFCDGGVATTNFTVAKVAEQPTLDVDNNNTNTENKEEIKEEDNSSNPKTFDNIMVYVAIAIMSVVGLGATVVIKKKKEN